MLQIDLLALVSRLRTTLGYSESNFKKYRSQLSALLPNLRKIVAPHHRNKSTPFFYKTGDSMVIFSDNLLELIAIEAERAIATANEMNLIAQDSGALKHRRRVNLRYSRAIERYTTLYELSKTHATQQSQLQIFALLNFTIGINNQENDEFFESVEAFQKAKTAVQISTTDQNVKEQLLSDINSRLEHCEYMASVFAEGDESVIQQVKISKKECEDEVLKMKIADTTEQQATQTLFGEQITIPKGNAGKVIQKAITANQQILDQNINMEIEALREFYTQKAQYFTQEGFFLAPYYYIPPSKPFPTDIKKNFKSISTYLNAISNLINITKQFSERPRPFDPLNLRKLLTFLQAQKEPIQQFYNKILALHYAFGLVNREFSNQKFALKRGNSACENAIFTIFNVKKLREGKIIFAGGAENLINQSVLIINQIQGEKLQGVESLIGSVIQNKEFVKGLLIASQLTELRQKIKPLAQNDQVYRLAAALPNPIFFDAVPEVIEAADCLWGEE